MNFYLFLYFYCLSGSSYFTM